MMRWCLFADVPSICLSADVTNSGLFMKSVNGCDHNHLSVSRRRWGRVLDNGRGFTTSPHCWELFCPTSFSFFPPLGPNVSLTYLPPLILFFFFLLLLDIMKKVWCTFPLPYPCCCPVPSDGMSSQFSAPLQHDKSFSKGSGRPRQCSCVLSLSCSYCCKNEVLR